MDTAMLRKAMRDHGITVTQMYTSLGISRKAFWTRCTGRTEFKQSEIVKIIDMLGVDAGTAIFFPQKVS